MLTTVAKKEAKKTVKYPISFEESFYKKANEHAESKGINLAGLIRMLLIEDMAKKAQA